METSVSVIICTKDRLGDLKETIESLGRQTRLPDELIVVDSSNSLAAKEYLEGSHSPFKYNYIHTTPGLTHQRNIGIANSGGSLLFFFDDDVELESDYIEIVETTFRRDTNHAIGAIGGRARETIRPSKGFTTRVKNLFSEIIKIVFLQVKMGSGNFRYSGLPTHPHNLTTSKYMQCLSGCCMAFRRKVFDKVTFDEKLEGYGLMEDADISKQLINAGYKIFYEASALLLHKVSAANRVDEKRLMEMRVANYVYLFRKNWKPTLSRKAAFYWTLAGMILLNIHKPEGRAGAINGIKRIINPEGRLPIGRST